MQDRGVARGKHKVIIEGWFDCERIGEDHAGGGGSGEGRMRTVEATRDIA